MPRRQYADNPPVPGQVQAARRRAIGTGKTTIVFCRGWWVAYRPDSVHPLGAIRGFGRSPRAAFNRAKNGAEWARICQQRQRARTAR